MRTRREKRLVDRTEVDARRENLSARNWVGGKSVKRSRLIAKASKSGW
jgi:hypothetical protein